MTTRSQEQSDSHLDLSLWWNMPLATIPCCKTDVTSHASLFPILSLLSPSEHSFISLPTSLTRSRLPFSSPSLGVISIWHTVNQGVSSGPLSDLSSSPTAPLCSGLSIREPQPGLVPPSNHSSSTVIQRSQWNQQNKRKGANNTTVINSYNQLW